MTKIASDRLIEVVYRGQMCRFDQTPVYGLDNPGIIYKALLTGRFYEHKFLDYIRTLQIHGVYVDVGSNIGTHALFFALMCPSTHVYAFEPRRQFFEYLLTNTALNGMGSKVTAYPLGLSDEPGEVTANLDGAEHVLMCRRLDDVITGRVDVIKIDVEGMEPKVIDGAARTLARWRPRIFAEAGLSHEYEAVVACLARHGYRPTGRVFNSTPTYEFVAERRLWEKPRDVDLTEIPRWARQSMRRFVQRHPALTKAVRGVRRLQRGRRPT